MAAVDIYPSWLGSDVYIDIRVIERRISQKDIEDKIFWPFGSRLHFLFEDEAQKVVKMALDRDSDIEDKARIDTFIFALNEYDRRLKEKWQNVAWIDSLIEISASDRIHMHADYREALLQRNRSRLRN